MGDICPSTFCPRATLFILFRILVPDRLTMTVSELELRDWIQPTQNLEKKKNSHRNLKWKQRNVAVGEWRLTEQTEVIDHDNMWWLWASAA